MEGTYTTSEGLTSTHFSPEVLSRQNSFCCNNLNSQKVIRWVGCKPGVFQSSKALFSSSDFALCSWFQSVDTYNFSTISLEPGAIVSIDIDAKYILTKASWPSDSLEELKLIELGVNKQPGYIGMTIPFYIGQPTNDYEYYIVKDLFHLNSNSELKDSLKINNISPYTVSLSILHAK